jgi:hypothetical protein
MQRLSSIYQLYLCEMLPLTVFHGENRPAHVADIQSHYIDGVAKVGMIADGEICSTHRLISEIICIDATTKICLEKLNRCKYSVRTVSRSICRAGSEMLETKLEI